MRFRLAFISVSILAIDVEAKVLSFVVLAIVVEDVEIAPFGQVL